MNENPRFEPYVPDRVPDAGEPVDPPAGMPALADAHGRGWSLTGSPEPAGIVPETPAPAPAPAPLGMLTPREVPGYRHAIETGVARLPSPLEPPTPLPGISGAWRTTITTWSPWIVFTLAIATFAPRGMGIWIFGVWAAVLAVAPLARRWCERRKMDELAAGYITLPVIERYPGRNSASWGLPAWNYTGTWAFTRSGAIKWAPDPTVDPPGFYPSQNHPERLQLWSGSEWLPQFRRLPDAHPPTEARVPTDGDG